MPYTAAYAALIAAVLNLIIEVLGSQPAAANPDSPMEHPTGIEAELGEATILRRAASYFLWIAGLLALIWLIGFLPAMFVFVVAYTSLGFGERGWRSLVYACVLVVGSWLIFDRGLHVPWPASVLGDFVPALRAATGFL